MPVNERQVSERQVSEKPYVESPPPPPRPLHFMAFSFTGFEPRDGISSLFRIWRGDFVAIRSDNEIFTIPIRLQQNDTPHVTGPLITEALDAMMSFRECGCKPSKKVVCHKHKEENLGE